MKKLALLSIILISFVGFAQQKVKPLENFDDTIFQIHKSFLLDGELDFGFMIIGLGSAEGVTYYWSIFSWQLEAQKSYLTAPDKRGTREISTTGGVSRRTVGLPTNSRQATAVRAAAKRDSAGREPWLTPVA